MPQSGALDHPKPRRAVVQQRAQDRIDAVLAATEKAIVAKGNESLTMVNIAARAGITHSSIYHYFKSVDEILVMLIWRLMAEYFEKTKAMAEDAKTAQELIETYAESKRLAWDKYRNTPTARGLYARARYLTTLRRIDDDYNTRRANVVCERFKQLVPNADHGAIRTNIVLTQSLTVPTFDFAMTRPKREQIQIVDEFVEIVRSRLFAVVGPDAARSAG